LDNCYCKNSEYFNALVDSLNDDTAVAFYEYLMNYEIKLDTNKIPMTDLRRRMMNMSKPLDQRFIDDIKSDDFKIQLHKNKIFVDDLYEYFRNWCENNGHYRKNMINKMNFKQSVEKYMNQTSVRIRIGDDRKFAITF
jgi:hypothetical protein